MSTVYLNGQSYSFESIKQQGVMLLTESERTHQASFKLIQDWLTNAEIFTFTTSGSTGIPKPIELTRAQLEASAKGTIEALSLNASDHFFVCMNTAFIGGAMLIVRGLIVGATLTLQEPSGNPLQLLPENHPYTFASFAPLQLFPILENVHGEQEKLNRFKQLLVGGGALDYQLETALAQLDVRVFHTYGMTETVSHIALKELGKQQTFQLLPGVHIRTDARDCLAVCCAATRNEWIQTNDVIERTDEHSFTILGRADDVINSGGIKIWPTKIEEALRKQLGSSVSNVFVHGIPDAKLGQKLIGVLETSNEIDQTAVSSQLETMLSKYELPKQYLTVTAFCYTPTGKTNKAETLKMIGL